MNIQADLLGEALAAIDKLQAELGREQRMKQEPIAIVGAGCRYPGGVTNPDQLWALIRDGIHAVAPIERWNVADHYHPEPGTPGKTYVNRAGMLDGIDQFDAGFFGISPREAATMDPQQRLLLETSYEALESAGISVESLAGSRTGVFVGATSPDFSHLMQNMPAESGSIYAVNGVGLHAMAGRISYCFGFMGPCVAVDTACSTSLVAVHLACQSLRAGESDVALAGGANVLLGPHGSILFSQGSLMARDGACKAFSAEADGFVRSEGAAVVALKRLSDAERDGDPILGVIRGSAVNSDGRSAGMAQPYGPAQEAVVRSALASAGLQPSDIDFVEAHGTGTPTGDPIEVEALANVLGERRAPGRPLLLGSVKTNLGHPEAASGVAGMLKTLWAMRHEQIPANLHFATPNPNVEWDRHPVRVVGEATASARHHNQPRRAGVSSFGFSGTNAHVIVEEAPAAYDRENMAPAPVLVPLSARGEKALADLATRHADHLAAHPELRLDDIALTLGDGRAPLPHRAALLAGTTAELEHGLRQLAAGDLPTGAAKGVAHDAAPVVAFLFTGQGSQYAGMGRGLYEAEPVFRDVLDRAAAIMDPLIGRSFLHILFGEGEDPALINETAYTQPALFAIEHALLELWRARGIVPAVVLGHSVGEFAAACAAGVFGFEDGLRLLAERGRLMQALPRDGAMAALFLPEAAAADAIRSHGDRLAIAAINGPEETVISGDAAALDEVLETLAAKGTRSQRLDVSHAFHSALLDPMLDSFEAFAASIPHQAPQITLVSNLTGAPFAEGEGPDAGYWRRHARHAVRFAPSIAALEELGIDVLLEVGPAPVLLALAGRAAPDAGWKTLASMRRGRDEHREMLAAARDLFVNGATLNWAGMPTGDGARRVALPTYAFQRARHWPETGDTAKRSARRTGGHDLLGERQAGPGPVISFLSELSADQPAFLAQHVIHDVPIMPGAGTVEIMLAAGRAIGFAGDIRLQQVVFARPLEFEGDDVRQVHTSLTPDADGYQVVVRSALADAPADEQAWIEHAHAHLSVGGGTRASRAPAPGELRPRASEEVSLAEYYADSAKAGIELGPVFQVRKEEWIDTDQSQAVSILEVSPDITVHPSVNVHATMLDGVVQVSGVLYPKAVRGKSYIPIAIDEVVLHRAAPERLVVTAHAFDQSSDESARFDIRAEDEEGRPVITITGLMSQLVSAESMGGGIVAQTMEPQWQPAVPSPEARRFTGRHLLVADRGGFAERLAAAIQAAGGSTALVDGADGLAAALRNGSGEAALVIDATALDLGDNADVLQATDQSYLSLLHVAQALPAGTTGPSLCVLTSGAHAIAPGDEIVPAARALVGLCRTLGVEQAGAGRFRIDLDSSIERDVRQVMAALALVREDEPEVALRHGAILAPRLKPLPDPVPADRPVQTVLTITERGDFDNLRFEESPRTPPAAHEVEIEVRASGLNFRDLINALGMYPAPVPPLGSECAGVITAVGADVEGLAIGDEVVAIAPASLASHCLCPRHMVVKKPANLSFAEVVTIPNAYLTAQLCLDVAGVKAGQRVLVHAAAGGVGSAAVRLAKLAGLEVFATAGSDRKRDFARARGATHVFDSRSTAFADEIMALTDGEGVDCVINSLAGEFIEAGLRITKPGGAFVEIGKQGLWTDEQVQKFAPGVRYRVEDLGADIVRAPERVHVNFVKMMELAASSEIDPLPLRVFPLSGAKEAFRHMANARHIGKVVLMPDRWAPPAEVRADGTYLVTGGLGGIGLLVVRWLIEHGAGHVVIASRRGGAGQEALLDELRSGATGVTAVACDSGDRAALARLWSDVLPGLPPLRGIIHAAGVLADAPIDDQDAERFLAVRRPKADGAWYLHELSARDPLDLFVSFSSTSALFGSPGQANYATANAFLDGLTAYRRLHGRPATSIAWGPWAEVGMAAGMASQQALWARGGMGLIDPADGIAAMARILSSPAPYAAVSSLNVRLFTRNAPPFTRALLGGKAEKARPATGGAKAGGSGALAAFKASVDADPAERQVLLQAFLHEEVARVLGFEPSALDPDTPLAEAGLDSLMAVQMRNTINAQLGLELPVKALLAGQSLTSLSRTVGEQILHSPEPNGEEADTMEEGML